MLFMDQHETIAISEELRLLLIVGEGQFALLAMRLLEFP
jgi:hypothetical protein